MFEILAISNRYKNTLDNLVDSLDLEHPEMLRQNGQRERNPIPNFRDDNNPPVGQEEYKKRRGMKDSKACKGCWDSRVEQVRGDRMSKVKVHHILRW